MKEYLAFPLLAIGAAVARGALGNTLGLQPKGLLKDLSFGLQLQQKLDQQPGTDGSDLLAQLAGMLQTGTPLATIIDRVAKMVSKTLTSATGNDGNTTRRRTLERALAAALAPPGTSPPTQNAAQQAASLERRLGDILSKISREIQPAGQQNRFPGAVLDAKSAREIPAQQQTKDATGKTPDGSLAFVQSILQNVAQQLRDAAPQTAAPQSAPGQDAQLGQNLQLTAAQSTQSQITTQSADVLGRMLARAAAADAQHNEQVSAAAAPAANLPAAAAPSATPSPAASPSELFARLMNVIAQTANENASRDGGKQSQEFAFAKSALPTIHHSSGPANVTPAPAFATAVSAATAPAAQQSAGAMPYTMDPQAVIEQLVKGIVLRNAGTTSEVRMRLQPEHLGDVSLKLTVSGNTISANIVAQNADVRDMLLSNQQQLARSLADAGLSLGAFSVDVSGGNPGFSERQTQQQRSLAKAGALHMSALGEDDTWADSRFGPPVLAGAKSLVLNYLA